MLQHLYDGCILQWVLWNFERKKKKKKNQKKKKKKKKNQRQKCICRDRSCLAEEISHQPQTKFLSNASNLRVDSPFFIFLTWLFFVNLTSEKKLSQKNRKTRRIILTLDLMSLGSAHTGHKWSFWVVGYIFSWTATVSIYVSLFFIIIIIIIFFFYISHDTL